MKSLIRRLIKWAAPELFANLINYVIIDGREIKSHGTFTHVKEIWQVPWQLTLPKIEAKEFSGGVRPPPDMPDFETFYRLRGSLDPVIYIRMEPAE